MTAECSGVPLTGDHLMTLVGELCTTKVFLDGVYIGSVPYQARDPLY